MGSQTVWRLSAAQGSHLFDEGRHKPSVENAYEFQIKIADFFMKAGRNMLIIVIRRVVSSRT
jgi:hypothetical protein